MKAEAARYFRTSPPVLAFALVAAGLVGCGGSSGVVGPSDGSVPSDGPVLSDASGSDAPGDGTPPGDGGAVNAVDAGNMPGDGSLDGTPDGTLDGTVDGSLDGMLDGTTQLSDGATEGAAADGSAGDATASDGQASGPVSFLIDVAKGPSRQYLPPAQPTRISDYIYGVNSPGGLVQRTTRWGLVRKGGNAYSAWNWTINYINKGNLACFWQGAGPGADAVAGAVTQDTDSIAAAQAKGEAYLATVPIGSHVAADHTNDTTAPGLCPAPGSDCAGGTRPSTGVNSGNLDFASTNPLSAAFVMNIASKPGAYCTCAPGGGCAMPMGGGADAGGACTFSSNPVYQDEFVNYLRVSYAGGAAPVFFDLDNEPNYWAFTHPELWSFNGALPCQDGVVSYDDIVTKDEQFAAAVKKGWPDAKVFGPTVAQDGIVYAHSYDKDPQYPTEFLDYYLRAMAAASTSGGTPLLDALDVHYYNAKGATAPQCLQNPRMFWDPAYTAISPAAMDALDFSWAGVNGYFDTNWYPRQVIPRLQRKITGAYPSGGPPAPGLSFSEYSSGCEAEIAGALAEADNLGIFGREGVFAAAAQTSLPASSNYLLAAFDLYRNYDGTGSVVGDTAVSAATSDVDRTSVFAFAHSDNGAAIDVVAINKSAMDVDATWSLANAPATLAGVKLFQIVDGNAAVVPVGGTPPTLACAGGTCTLAYTLPKMSATTLVLR
jgi:hypothetical protein